jgi:hypothetical protein
VTAAPAKKKSPLWFKAVVGVFALLLLGIAGLLMIPTSTPPEPADASLPPAVVANPPALSITTSAEAAAVLGERLPRAFAFDASLDGVVADGVASVAVGSPLAFAVVSERAGYLLVATRRP